MRTLAMLSKKRNNFAHTENLRNKFRSRTYILQVDRPTKQTEKPSRLVTNSDFPLD